MFEGMMDDTARKVMFNTGTFFDLMNGTFEVGLNGQAYLNGGLGTYITALHGRGNTYKSTLLDGFQMGVLRNYDNIHCFIFDSEYSKDKVRISKFMISKRMGEMEVSNRITLKSDPTWNLEKTWEFIYQICQRREKEFKELKMTTPFISVGKLQEILTPTIIFIDSLSELRTKAFRDFVDEKNVDDAKFRTLYMEDGNRKTMFLSALSEYASQYGVIIMVTARTGNNQSLTNAPPAKELTHQRQGDKIKEVGAKFTTLTQMLTQVLSCRNCLHSDKSVMYPYGETSELDLQELEVNISRNKMKSSGLVVPFVVSQEYGLLNDVTYLNFLRRSSEEGTAPGLTGRGNYKTSWYPEVSFTRNNIRELLVNDYKLARALELVAQYVYIGACWNTTGLRFDFNQTPELIFDKLMAAKVDMNDILETTSIWNPVAQKHKPKDPVLGAQGRVYMSLIDILGKIQ